MEYISKPFGMLMMWLYNVTQNYGIAIILFAIIVRLIMLPFQMKSKRGMMRMQLVQPQIQELQKKYASNQQKLGEEMQKLYREENVNPMSGCLWSLIPFPILIALYYAIREPITCMMGIAREYISEGGALLERLIELGYEAVGNAGYAQIGMTKFISEHFSDFSGIENVSDKLVRIDYSFLGMDLGTTPDWQIWKYSGDDLGRMAALFVIPVVAALLSYATSVVTQKLNPPADPQANATNQSMQLMMPVTTLVFCFMMPAALGLYWAMGSVLSIIQEVVLTRRYRAQLSVEMSEHEEARKKREAELEAKRRETERLRALNATRENEGTSKKKKETRAKTEKERQEREWAQKASGEEEEYEPSRVGHRKYARGRAYDPDRFTRKLENTGASDAEAEDTGDLSE